MVVQELCLGVNYLAMAICDLIIPDYVLIHAGLRSLCLILRIRLLKLSHVLRNDDMRCRFAANTVPLHKD